jgi:hypothetical protein
MTSASRSATTITIADAVAGMPSINLHDHAWRSFSVDHGQEFDLPSLLCAGGIGSDLVCAGFQQPPDLFAYLSDPSLPDGAENAWVNVRPFLDHVRTTSYFRTFLRSLRDLFGVEESHIFSNQWQEASRRIRSYSRQNKGSGPQLCSRMNVAATVLDAKLDLGELQWVQPGSHRVLHVLRLDMFIHEERGLAETRQRFPTTDLDQWLSVFDAAFQGGLAAGAAGFKSGLAYNRAIEYGDPSKDDVARIFRDGVLSASPAAKIAYQDFMMNRLCRLCTEASVPLQIHSGLHAGNRGILENSRPTLLTSLFRRHGDLRVDLFHGGYPWCIPAGIMAKYFPNVYIDGCWLPQISPSAYRSALRSWIETVPSNKILAWGGDSTFLEQSYATLLLAKDLIAETLADLVDRDYFDIAIALNLARAMLHDNGAAFWRLN